MDFSIDRSVPLYQSTTAQVRYLNLIGDRYLELKRGEGEGSDRILPPGGFIPVARTSPALDLDALIGGFKPLFRALDPDKVNTIATALVTVFQGQGGTINDILDNTAQLTSQIGERDQAIGEVIKNLNIVLDTTVRHRQQFDQTVNNLEVLITGLNNHRDQLAGGTAHISNAAGTVADLLGEDRALLHKTLNYLDAVQQPLIDQRDQLRGLRPPGADRAEHDRARHRVLRGLREFLRLRHHAQDQRAAGRWSGSHGPALPAADG